MRKLTQKFVDWCDDTSKAARIERTVVQAILAGVVGGLSTGQWGAAVVTSILVGVLAVFQATIGKANEADKD